MRPLALLPLVVVAILWLVFCFYDLRHHEVRWLPKWAWGIIIVISIPLGGVVYLAVGRRW